MDKLIKKLTKASLDFRDERNWGKFHNGKDLAMCLSIEANEIQELFLWKNENEVNIESLKDEIGDVFYTLLLLSNKYSIDIELAILDKIKKTRRNIP